MSDRSTPWRKRWALVLVGMAVGVACLVPQSAFASGNGSWDLQPPADLSTDGTSIDLELSPGTSREAYVDVVNLTRETLTLNLSTTGGRIDTPPQRWDADGNPVSSPDTATWIQLGSTTVQLARETSQRVPFLVTIPATAVPGDYLAAVFSSGSVTVDPVTGERTTRGWQSLLRLRVSGPTLTSLTPTGLTVDGTEAVLGLRNTGGIRLTPTLTIVATNAAGQPVVATPPLIPPLESGDLSSVRIQLSEPAAAVSVTVTSEAGTDTLQWPVPTLDGAVLPSGAAAPIAGTSALDGPAIAALAIAVLLLLVAVLTARRDRRRKRERQRAERRRQALLEQESQVPSSLSDLLDGAPPTPQGPSIVSPPGPHTIIAPR